MKKLNHLVLALAVGAVPLVFAQTPPPAQPPAGDPSSASSPHQRETTEQKGAEAPTSASQTPDSASSPHQRQTTGKEPGDQMKMAAAEKAGADPASFVKMAAQMGMTEVEVAKLAARKGQDEQVREFAQRMIQDHSTANKELAGLAQRKGWSVPTSLDSEHQAVVQKLSTKSGADFDGAYSKQMMADHEKTVALFESASRSSDAELASWAKKKLPTLKEHRHMASALPAASSESRHQE